MDPLAEAERPALERLGRDPSSRRRFLQAAGGVGTAGALGAVLAACGDEEEKPVPPGGSANFGPGDAGIVNYALTLEYIEADFYAKATKSGKLSGEVQSLAQAILKAEQEHVAALEATVRQLNAQPARRPKTDFPLENQKQILDLAATVENLGAAAYLGAAPNIRGEDVLGAALSIHTVEGRHAAALNRAVGKPITPDGAFAKPASEDDVLNAVKPYIVA